MTAIRYGMVGIGNTVISLVAYAVLVLVEVPAPAAAAGAFGCGALHGYVMNRSWTFHARDSFRSRVTYLAVQAIGMGSTAVLVWIATGPLDLPKFLAEVLALPPVTAATFVLNSRWTFSRRRRPAPGGPRPAIRRAFAAGLSAPGRFASVRAQSREQVVPADWRARADDIRTAG